MGAFASTRKTCGWFKLLADRKQIHICISPAAFSTPGTICCDLCSECDPRCLHPPVPARPDFDGSCICVITSVECWLFLQGDWVNAALTSSAFRSATHQIIEALLTFILSQNMRVLAVNEWPLLEMCFKRRLPHRRTIMKLSGHQWHTSTLCIRRKRRTGRLTRSSVELLNTWLKKKKKWLSLQCMHACSAQPKSGGLPPDYLPAEPLQEEGDIVTRDKCWRREMKPWECAWIHDQVRKAAAPRRMCVTEEGKMKGAYTSSILVDFMAVAP